MSLSPRASRTPASTSADPLVLHVTEAMGGGLQDAVHDFIRSAPQYRHALLFTRRGQFETAEPRPDLVEVVDAGRGFRSLSRVYSEVVDRIAPDVIHLHSAWAGLIGRTRSRGPRRAALVYSPHSYYFDRMDLPRTARAAARVLECALARRTDLTAAVSPFEAETAATIGSRAAYIPNIVRLPDAQHWRWADGAPHVVLVGRVTAQKDPEFLLRVIEHVRPQAPEVRWTWVGSGDAAAEQRLREAGVDITGWITRSECLALMTSAGAYLHTAAWEGSPITLLEAATIGVPIVARSIPALDSLGFDRTLRTPEAVGRALLETLQGHRVPLSPLAPAPDAQARALGRAYASLLPAPALQPVPVPMTSPAVRLTRAAGVD